MIQPKATSMISDAQNPHEDDGKGSLNISVNYVDKSSDDFANTLAKVQANRRRTSADENISYSDWNNWMLLDIFCF